jgi:hypothetical protein
VFAAAVSVLRAEVHVLAGRQAEAEADLRATRRELRNTSAAQFALPIAWIEAALMRANGDFARAQEVLEDALAARDRDPDDERSRCWRGSPPIARSTRGTRTHRYRRTPRASRILSSPRRTRWPHTPRPISVTAR